MFRNFLAHRDLFWQLTFREIKARYKQSVLGYAWAILVPLINLLVLSVVFSKVFRVPTNGVPYPVFLFVALIPWLFLNNSLTTATGSVIANSSLITKVKLPREILPLAAICAKLVDLILTGVVLILFLIFFHISFQTSMLLVPVVFLFQFLLVCGLGLILSATNVFFRDIENVLGVFLTIWMYLTPILYAPTLIPDNLRMLFYLNPMTGIINAYRSAWFNGGITEPMSFIYSAVFSVSIFIIGIYYFSQRSKYFADTL